MLKIFFLSYFLFSYFSFFFPFSFLNCTDNSLTELFPMIADLKSACPANFHNYFGIICAKMMIHFNMTRYSILPIARFFSRTNSKGYLLKCAKHPLLLSAIVKNKNKRKKGKERKQREIKEKRMKERKKEKQNKTKIGKKKIGKKKNFSITLSNIILQYK